MFSLNMEHDESSHKRHCVSRLTNPFLWPDTDENSRIRRHPSPRSAFDVRVDTPLKLSLSYTFVSKNMNSESYISAVDIECIVVHRMCRL